MKSFVDNDINILSGLFERFYGEVPLRVLELIGSGSNRKYYRFVGSNATCIGVAGDDERECRAFVNLSRKFKALNIQVPEVYIASDNFLHYLQQDLGDETIMKRLVKLNEIKEKRGQDLQQDSALLTKLIGFSLMNLAKLQSIPPVVWEKDVEYPAFDRRQVMFDLNYFKYEFLKAAKVIYDEHALEDDFESFAAKICSGRHPQGFMYRDFQSRNIMLHDEKPWFIDFQGGRKGPILYDAVSFLWQAKANYKENFRRSMLDIYFSSFPDGVFTNNLRIRYEDVDTFILFRTFQVLGAYGFRGLVEKKSHFIESIPLALKNLEELLEKGALDEYPELKKACSTVCTDERFKSRESDKLRVTVFSFAYLRGYPEDLTGNGGGFMFDCRGMHNPGRYDEYKDLTGFDKEVIDFLEERGEVQGFVEKALDMTQPSIDTYLRRGFKNLQVGFGCTGGRHRSVYCAERYARTISERYPQVEVKLVHRERNITKDL